MYDTEVQEETGDREESDGRIEKASDTSVEKYELLSKENTLGRTECGKDRYASQYETVSRHNPFHEKILYASVIIVMIAIVSIIHCLGTLFPYFLEEFGESRAKTAAVQSTFISVGLCSGILVGLLVQHYGPRVCGIIGGALFSLGFILSAFATSVTYLIITFGAVSGLGGLCFLFISACQAVSQCFQGKTKLVALSVATGVIGIGGTGYPYLLKICINHFGLKGTLLLLGGISMNAVPLAILWSPPGEKQVSKVISRVIQIKDKTEHDTTLVEHKSKKGEDSNDVDSHNKGDLDKTFLNHEIKQPTVLTDIDSHNATELDAFIVPESKNDNTTAAVESYITINPLNKGNVHHQTCIHKKTHNGNANQRTKNSKKVSGLFSVFLPTIKYKPFFILVCCFGCVTPALNMFEVLLLDVLETSGLSRDSSVTSLIIYNSFAIPGRIFPGFVNKIPRCSSGMSSVLGTIISMIGAVLLIFTSGYAANILSVILLGLSKGIILGSMTVVALDMLGSSRLSTGMGIMGCVNGTITAAIGPLHGFIRDKSGSYTISLIISAVSMLVAMLFACLSMVLQRKARIKKSKLESFNVDTS